MPDKKDKDTLRNEHIEYINKLEQLFSEVRKELYHAYIQLKVYDDFKGY